MAKAELGTKRTCPDTGKKFYDLGKDPVVSPYTGKSWPLSYFEESSVNAVLEKAEEEEVAEVDAENTEVNLGSSSDDDMNDNDGNDDIPDIDDDDVEIDGDDDDTFLEEDDDDDNDDVSGIIGVGGEDDES